MNSLEKLAEIFKRFPGIGPRQAKRFVYYLLNRNETDLATFAELVKNLKKDINQCPECRRFFALNGRRSNLCDLCADPNREPTLLIVEKDADLDNLRKTGTYNGYYFVLGSLATILGKNIAQEIHLDELITRVKHRLSAKQLDEVILALSASTEGDHTADLIKEKLTENFPNLKISLLGRGLSTGTELEYSDSETIKSALKNRA